MKRRAWRAAAVLLLGLAAGAAPAQAPRAPATYDLRFEIRIVPSEKKAHVAIHLSDPARAFEWMRFRIDPERHLAFRGDGAIDVEAQNGTETVQWTPGRAGAVLRYAVRVDHLRDESSYDARITRDWVLMRFDDLVPTGRASFADGASSRSRLQLVLPERWSAVVPYASEPDGTWRVDRPERRLDRPTGWLLAGRLGVMRERVAGVRLAIGGPVGHRMRRQDMLALLRFTLPALRKIAPLPERIAIVGAGDPMWRGGLSGPNGAYLHTDLPLISEDTTSPLLHEIVHVMLRARAGPYGDGIVEGLAELYSLEALRRSKAISQRRYERAFDRLAREGRGVTRIAVDNSRSDTTARAVVLLRELDAEIRRVTGNDKSLDDVLRALIEAPATISLEHFREVTERVAGQRLPAWFGRPELTPARPG